MSNVYKAVLRGRVANAVEIRNVFYVETSAGTEAASLDVATWIASILSPINSFISIVCHFYSIDLYVRTEDHWALSAELPFAHAGGDVGEMSPFQIAAVVVARTAIARVLPKKFFAGFGEGSMNSGTLTGSVLLALTDTAAAWVTPFTGSVSNEYTPGTWSTKENSFVAFEGFVLDSIVGTQRRRKPSVGI